MLFLLYIKKYNLKTYFQFINNKKKIFFYKSNKFPLFKDFTFLYKYLNQEKKRFKLCYYKIELIII